jgi:hypothetical protein
MPSIDGGEVVRFLGQQVTTTEKEITMSTINIPPRTNTIAPEQTGWVGWVMFGATMMMIIGAFGVLQGILAIYKDEVFVVPTKDLVVTVDYTTWGWVHLIVALVVFAAGVGLLSGRTWARVLGVAAVSVSMIINFAFVAAYPFWCLTSIALAALVLFAIIAHGQELRSS